MSDKIKIPFHVQVQVEERPFNRPGERWHAQFVQYPLGYFRGRGATPAAALGRAWRRFRREVSPGRRWWLASLPRTLTLDCTAGAGDARARAMGSLSWFKGR
jgi:hypothetical protein